MITESELDILDEIGGQVSCKQCSKYGTALCPNFHAELEAVRSVFNQDIRFTKVFCKAFDFKREHYRLGYDLWLGVDKYIEYLKQYWWNQGKDNKWQYVGFFLNHTKDVTYYVPFDDYYNGKTFDSNGNLKAVKKSYHGRKFDDKKKIHYPIVWEELEEPTKVE